MFGIRTKSDSCKTLEDRWSVGAYSSCSYHYEITNFMVCFYWEKVIKTIDDGICRGFRCEVQFWGGTQPYFGFIPVFSWASLLLIWLHTHISFIWITIKSFLLSFDTPQESLLLTTASHPPHPHLSRTGIPPLSLSLADSHASSLSCLPHLDL